MKSGPIELVAVDHAGLAVSSRDEAVRFWTDAMGFSLERTSEMSGDFLSRTTGVADAVCRVAIVSSPGGFVVELLEYSNAASLGRAPDSAGAIGATHLAFTVLDIKAAVARIEAEGWRARGAPQSIPAGPKRGTLVAYVSGPDGITIELMQPPA